MNDRLLVLAFYAGLLLLIGLAAYKLVVWVLGAVVLGLSG
jgi:hypothetical protein